MMPLLPLAFHHVQNQLIDRQTKDEFISYFFFFTPLFSDVASLGKLK